jgi:hypothetical protein
MITLSEFLSGKPLARVQISKNVYHDIVTDKERAEWQHAYDHDPAFAERQWQLARDRYLVRAGEMNARDAVTRARDKARKAADRQIQNAVRASRETNTA